uniref:Uncharacterized protein n=1 Tax=Arundo donax TaxID=35708 RepID=A0A0A8YIU3_ARUDO
MNHSKIQLLTVDFYNVLFTRYYRYTYVLSMRNILMIF